jgi:hypothetical protein
VLPRVAEEHKSAHLSAESVRAPDRFRWPLPAVLRATYSSDLIGSTIGLVSGTELMSALLHLPSQAEEDEPIFHCLLAHIEAVGIVPHKGTSLARPASRAGLA